MSVEKVLIATILVCLTFEASIVHGQCDGCLYMVAFEAPEEPAIRRGRFTLSEIIEIYELFTVELGYNGTTDPCNNYPEDACGDNALCTPFTDDLRFFYCECMEGNFEEQSRRNFYSCTDVDECEIPNDCDENANCTNTPGSYECTCREGYFGNGSFCEAILYPTTTPPAVNSTMNSSTVIATTPFPTSTAAVTSTTTVTPVPTTSAFSPSTTVITTTELPATTTPSTTTTQGASTTTKSLIAKLAEIRMSLWLRTRQSRKLKIKSYRNGGRFPVKWMDGRPRFKPRCL